MAGNSALFVAVATGDGQVSDTDTLVGDELGPSDVVYNPTDNEFLIVWQEKQAGEWDIYGQQLHVGNGLYGGLITISSANQGQQRPRAAHNPDDDQYLGKHVIIQRM